MSGKTLYISDLDGTLLNSGAELSGFTAETLKSLSARGIYFTAATARTAATAAKLLDGLGLRTPAVLMNGVCVFDVDKKEYIKVEVLPDTVKRNVTGIIGGAGLPGFWYSVEDGTLFTRYTATDSPGAKAFIEERQKKYGKVFTKIDSLDELNSAPVIYYSISDRESRLSPVLPALREVDGMRMEYYRDIYEKDCFFLEICSGNASKKTAVDFIREKYGFTKIVGFGDNYNDLPLLEACDEFYAVGNAVDELKKRADGVILPNTEDGVAHWLLENAE